MRSTMIRDREPVETARARLCVTCTDEHVTRAPERSHLNEQAESTILATISLLVLASLSVGCVIGIGICRTLGAR